MNEVWTFSTLTMTWQEHKTCGEVPSVRSNCTAHYDAQSDSVILFGGGGPNKARFNALSVLNWSTKEWSTIEPEPSEEAPWERTYHSSAMLYPYLIVFGG
jgi:hypothetical protein